MHAVVVAGSSLTERAGRPIAYLLRRRPGRRRGRGAEALSRVGLVPDILVGDMDSITAAPARRLRHGESRWCFSTTAKDETDTEAALRLAVDRGADDVTVYGALGGPRLDHLVGNLLLLSSPWLAGVRAHGGRAPRCVPGQRRRGFGGRAGRHRLVAAADP